MNALKKNIANLGSKVKAQATDITKQYELDTKAEIAKNKAEAFVQQHELDAKAEIARNKAEAFVQQHELDTKAEIARNKAEAFAHQHNLDTKAEQAKNKLQEVAKDLGLITEASAVYPEVIQGLGFKIIEKNNTDTKAKEEEIDASGTVAASTSASASSTASHDEKKSFASKYAPSLSEVQEGSIVDTLLKAKAKVFGGVAIGAGVAAGGAAAENAKEDGDGTGFDEVMKDANELYTGPGDVTVEELKKHAEEISSEMEESVKNATDSEEAQKVLVPLMAKLTLAKNKFIEMTSKKDDDEKEIEAQRVNETGTTETKKDDTASEETKLPSEYAADDLKFRAEKAAKMAFENAEKTAINVAAKVGIIKATATVEGEAKKEEETTTAPTETAMDKESK